MGLERLASRFGVLFVILAVTLAGQTAFANTAPVADAGGDTVAIDTDGDGFETVTLDGSGSTDADGTIVEYAWASDTGLSEAGQVVTPAMAVGLHEVTLTVTDDGGATGADTISVRVYARPTEIQLDLADGFNIDVWCGPLEIQAVYDYASGYDPDLDLAELQGGLGDGVGFGLVNGGSLLVGASIEHSYSTSFNWNHPIWVADGQGTPEDGVLAGADGRGYHIASVAGNATYPGDWLEGAAPGIGWPIVPNVLVAGSAHRIEDWQIVSTTAELPESQKGAYADVNFVLAATASADRARSMQIVALYGPDGTDEEVVYAFETADGGSGPVPADLTGGAGFAAVYTYSKVFINHNGATGALADSSGSLYEFETTLPLNVAKDLWGFRVEDSTPSLQNNARGLMVFAATAMKVGTDTNVPPTANAGGDQALPDDDGDGIEAVTLDGTGSADPDGTLVDWTWTENEQTIATGATATLDMALGVHEIVLTVTDDQGATDADSVTVTVHNPLGFNTYYVDFEAGSDSNTGLSPQTAWKHSPGDPNAAGIPTTTALYYGDTIIFKGGVVYRGKIGCHRSGQAGDPIVYDGNTAGTFGEGRAIIDGSVELTGWTQCADADEADGNPHWADIYWTYAPAGTTAFNQAFFEDAGLLHPAQDPNVYDPFYHDNLDHFLTHDAYTDTSITDYDYFTMPDPTYWDGSTYMYIHGGNNAVIRKAVTGYDPAANTIMFESMGTVFYTTYAMVNSLKILDVPGEFVVREDQTDGAGRPKVYLMPLTPGVAGKEFSITDEDYNVHFGSASYVTFRGFELRKTGGDEPAVTNTMNTGCTGLTVEDCIIINHAGSGIGLDDVTESLFADNQVRFCKSRGIIISEAIRSSIRNNTLQKNGGTAIDYYWSHDSEIVGNTVYDNEGGHANGITVYLDSSNILIKGNRVWGGNVACTFQASTNLTIAYNIFDGNGTTYAVADWGSMTGYILHNNYILNGGVATSSSSTGVVSKNNIMPGSGVIYVGGVSENNIYTSLSWTQDADNLGPGEFMATEDELFVDFANGDYHLKPGSPAIDAGLVVPDLTDDFDGTAVPQGEGVDVGPYEFVSAARKPGDADGDDDVDLNDFVILKTNFGSGTTWEQGDFDGDGDVDLNDFVILKTHFGT